jgi:hypothetical protein
MPIYIVSAPALFSRNAVKDCLMYFMGKLGSAAVSRTGLSRSYSRPVSRHDLVRTIRVTERSDMVQIPLVVLPHLPMLQYKEITGYSE